MLLQALVACAGVTLGAVAITLDNDATPEQVQTLLELTERYCVVYQTLARPPQLALSHRIAEADLRG